MTILDRRAVAIAFAPLCLGLAAPAEAASLAFSTVGTIARDGDGTLDDLSGPNGTAVATLIQGELSASYTGSEADLFVTRPYVAHGSVQVGPFGPFAGSVTETFALGELLLLGAVLLDNELGDFVLDEALPFLLDGNLSSVETVPQLDPLPTGYTLDYSISDVQLDASLPDASIHFLYTLGIVEDVVGQVETAFNVDFPDVFGPQDFDISASVKPIPVPAALPLLGGGLALLGFVARRRRA